MAETTKVFTGKLEFTTNLPEIAKQIDAFAKAANGLPKIINGKVQPIDPKSLTSTDALKSKIVELTAVVDGLNKKLKESGKSSAATLPATMDNIVKAGGAGVNTLKNQMDGLYLSMTKNGNAAQGVREIFFGTASSTNFFAKQLDNLASKSIGFGNTQTKLQGQMEGVANTADRSARAMALSGKAFQATVYESLGPGSAQMVQPFLQQISRARIAVEGVGKAASAGKDTANSLRQAQIAVKGLQNEYELLTSAGIIKSGTAADIAFKKMIKQAQDAKSQVQAMASRYEQTKKNVDETKKSTDAASTSTKNFAASIRGVSVSGEQQNSILARINLSLGNLAKGFKGLITINSQTSSQLQQMGNSIEQLEKKTTGFGNVAQKIFGATFWGTALGTITGRLLPALFDRFYELNSLIQNTEISIDKMLTGSSVNAQDAIAGFTQYIQKTVAATPFEMADAIDASMKMIRQGFDPQIWLTPVADVAAAMNKPLDQIVGAMTKMAAGAKGMAVDMFRDIGISVNNVGAVYDKTTKTAVSFEEAQKANAMTADEFSQKYERLNWQFNKSGELINGTGDAMAILNAYWQQSPMFTGAAQARSLSLGGVISNLKDNFSSLLVALGKPVFQNLTLAASGLLGKFNDLMPVITTIATAIGTWLAGAINVVNGLIFNFQTTIGTLLPSINQIGYIVQSVISGDWTAAWWGAQQVLADVLVSVVDTLENFATGAMDWGYNFVVEIANGIIDAANGALIGAMNYVGDTIANFLEPGSPPKEGPLSTIDKWGQGVMDVFNEGMRGGADMPFVDGVLKAMLELQTAQNKVVSSNKKVAAVQKEIASAEKKGYIPAALKEKLALAQDGVKLAQDEVDFRKIQLQQQQELAKESKKEASKTSGEQNKANKSNDAMASASERAAKAVKQTWQEAYADNLAQLEEKRRLGVLSEEEYLKDLLKLEKDYVDDSLKDGVVAGLDDHVLKVKELQSQLEALKPAKKTGAGGMMDNIFAFKQDPVDVIMQRFVDLPKKMGDIATAGAEEFVANIQVRTKTVGESIPNTILSLIADGWEKVREFVKNIPREWIFPFSALVGVFAAPILEPILESVTKIGPALKWLIGNFSSLAGILWRLSKIVLRFSVYGFIVYGMIVNWDEVVAVASAIFGALSGSIGLLISNIHEFIKTIYESGAAQEIFSNVMEGISNLGLTATQVFGLLKKVFKVAVIGTIIPAITAFGLFIDRVIEKMGGIKKFTQGASSALLLMSKRFKAIALDLTELLAAIFEGKPGDVAKWWGDILWQIQDLFTTENPFTQFFGNIWTSIKSVFSSMIEPIKAQIYLFINNIKTSLFQYWNSTVLPLFTQWGKDALSWAIYAYANIPTALTYLLNGISTFFENNWPTVYAALATWIPKIWSWVQQAALGAGVALNALLLTFSAWAASGDGQAAIARFGENLGKFITDSLKLLFANTEGANSVMGTLLLSLGAAVLQLAFIAAEVGANIVAGIFAGVMTSLTGEKWTAATANQLGEVFKGIASNLDTILEYYFGDVGRSIIAGIVSAFIPAEMLKSLTGLFETVIPQFKAYLGIASPSTVFAEIGVDLMLGLIGGLASIIPNLLSSATDIAGKLISSIKTALGLDGGLGGLASSLFGGAAPTTQASMQIAPADMTASTSAVSTFASQVGPIIMNVQNLFIGLKNEILNTINAFAINFVGGFIALDETLTDNVALIRAHVVTGFTSMMSEVVNATIDMTSRTDEAIRSVRWEDLGMYIMMGIAKGIQDNRKLVLDKLVELAKDAIKIAQASLGISSPSVKFYEIGVQSVAGLVAGLESGEDTTQKTVRNLMEKSMKYGAKEIYGKGAFKQVKAFFHFYGTTMTDGMAKLNDANKLTTGSLKQLAEQTMGMPIPETQLKLFNKYGQQIVDEYKKVSAATKQAFATEQIQKASDLLGVYDQTMTKFDEHVNQLQADAASTLNELVGVADMDIDATKLQKMMDAIKAGKSYGADMDAAIKDAWTAQDKLNGALGEQAKMQKDLLKIEEQRQKIDLMTQQLELAQMIKDNNLNGEQVMQGLQLGAEASVSDVTAAIARALEQMVAKAQGALGIASPSKVFESMGMNIGAGLDKGVLVSLANVKATMANMGNFTLDALTNGLNTGGAMLNANGLGNLGGNMGMTQNNEFNTTVNDKIDLQFFKQLILDTVSKGI